MGEGDGTGGGYEGAWPAVYGPGGLTDEEVGAVDGV